MTLIQPAKGRPSKLKPYITGCLRVIDQTKKELGGSDDRRWNTHTLFRGS